MSGATLPAGQVDQVEAEELLKAGAVLPPGTEGGGERVVPLTARTYRHPGLDDRVVVRLVAGELGAAEDLVAGFLGLEQAAAPVVVGLGLRRSLGFPEWVLVHHPEDGHHALGVVPELERAGRQAKTKPKAALEAYQQLAEQLARSVPHFLPTFYEQAGRVFVAVENPTYAAQMFTKARRAEAEYGLAVDEDRLDAVFLEFALAGALPVKVLSGYAKELAARVSPAEAFERFRRLCVRRTAGGLPPSAQMATDLRRLARAAGADADVEERSYLAELLGMSATLRAATGWWKSHRPALVELGRRDPAARGAMLNIMPSCSDDAMPPLWLEILEESGAAAGLVDADLSAQERPADGAADWLKRFLKARNEPWGVPPRLPGLYALVERAADRVRTELAESGQGLTAAYDVDLLDLLLALDIPVADPGEGHGLLLEDWAKGEGQRDLVALASDARFQKAFNRAANGFSNDTDGNRAVRLLAGSPGGRPMLAEWVRNVARRSSAAGLPQLPDALRRLTWLPGEALVLAEEEVRAAAGTDLAPVLARTLQAGLFDELGWPAWEEAAAALVAKKDVDDLVVADAWPHLIVAGPSQARVIGTEGTVLTHDLRVPSKDTWGDPGFHFVDGELLVYWQSRELDNRLKGYWHLSAGQPQPLEGDGSTRGTRMDYYRGNDPVTLPVPGGGRTTGMGMLHRGDTAVPGERSVLTDGTSFWTWTWDGADHATTGWYEFDPATGEHGRKGLPGFLADALNTAPPGSKFEGGSLLPAPSDEATPCGAPVGGMLGWRVVRLPDGSLRGEDLAGRTVTVPPGSDSPGRALTLPGDDRPRAVVRNGYRISLLDPDGVVTAVAKTDDPPGEFGEGTLILPPLRYWHCLRPRDPEGSVALRRIDRETAAALLKAATTVAEAGQEELRSQIRMLLPQVSDDSLVAGIAGVVRFAAKQQAVLDAAAARLMDALAGGHQEQPPTGPADELLHQALSGLVRWNTWQGPADSAFRQIRSIGKALRDVLEPAPDGPLVLLHLDGPELPNAAHDWETVLEHSGAVAFRAASVTVEQRHRDTLREFLEEADALGLATAAEPARWRRFVFHVDRSLLTTASGDWRTGAWAGLLPLDGGAFLAILRWGGADGANGVFTALFHDPAGRFDVPEPYRVRESAAVGASRDAGWLGAFLSELAAHGPVPWRPEAADEFARLTGVSQTLARLVLAGMPNVDDYERNFLPKEVRATLGVKVADAAIARGELSKLDTGVRRAIVAALLPEEPARLWADGPDVAAAAAVWNSKVGRRTAVPEWLLADAVRAVRTPWQPSQALPALLDPAAESELSVDLAWTIRGDRAHPVDSAATGFTARTLIGAVTLTGWLAHRLPAGDPLRAALPATLAAVRDRLASPDLMLDLERYADLPEFRKVAGAPTEVGEGWERYGAVVLSTHDNMPAPALRTALLDAAGSDPYLAAVRGDSQEPFPAEVALRTARDPRFEALLADPGDPAAGERDADGTWWPQDPVRSAPALVAEVAKEHGLGEDAAVVYLTLLAMPDPTDRNVARWTGWKPARLKAARAELAATDLVVEASRSRAGRSLFLPGGWVDLKAPLVPLEQWKFPLFDLAGGQSAPQRAIVPLEPAADLYRRAWQRVQDGDTPRFGELKVKRGRRR